MAVACRGPLKKKNRLNAIVERLDGSQGAAGLQVAGILSVSSPEKKKESGDPLDVGTSSSTRRKMHPAVVARPSGRWNVFGAAQDNEQTLAISRRNGKKTGRMNGGLCPCFPRNRMAAAYVLVHCNMSTFLGGWWVDGGGLGRPKKKL